MKRISFDGVFPEKIPSEQSQWATYIPARNPQFKIHTSRGLANNAMGQRHLGELYALYEFQNGLWTKVFEYIPYNNCDRCNKPFNQLIYNRWQTARNWEDKGKRPWEGGNVICQACKNADDAERRRIWQEQQDRATLKRLSAQYPTE